MVPLAPATLQLVVGARPLRLGNGKGGPLVKALPYELRTSKAEMYPTAFPTALRHGCDPRQGLHLGRVSIALPLRTERCQQPRCHHRSGSRDISLTDTFPKITIREGRMSRDLFFEFGEKV